MKLRDDPMHITLQLIRGPLSEGSWIYNPSREFKCTEAAL